MLGLVDLDALRAFLRRRRPRRKARKGQQLSLLDVGTGG